MSLKIGIVGLPNVGKSTLFNALASRRIAKTAKHLFTTIDPHEAVVPVPDKKLDELAALIKPEQKVPATITFIDIAGLVAGAHKGEGLGNQFLAHIRECDMIVHLLRVFEDESVASVSTSKNFIDDKTVVESELILADLATLSKQEEPKGSITSEDMKRWEIIQKLRDELKRGKLANDVLLTKDEYSLIKPLHLLTAKPMIYILNVSESQLLDKKLLDNLAKQWKNSFIVSALLEEELIDVSEKDRNEYVEEYGISALALDQLILRAYATLNLITFYTIKGGKEVHAWGIEKGLTALLSAGIVHTDFMKAFINAQVINVDTLIRLGGWKEASLAGKVCIEGRDYQVQDLDVIEFITGR